MDKQNLKNPYVWMIAVAVILGIWTLYSTAAMLDQRQKTDKRAKVCRTVQEQAEDIRFYQQQAGKADAGDVRTFQGESSARECAAAAAIPVATRLERGQSRQKILKSGEVQYTETYNLRAVRLIQVALFIDHAETNFSSVSCTNIDLTPTGGSAEDSWNVSITLRYIGL